MPEAKIEMDIVDIMALARHKQRQIHALACDIAPYVGPARYNQVKNTPKLLEDIRLLLDTAISTSVEVEGLLVFIAESFERGLIHDKAEKCHVALGEQKILTNRFRTIAEWFASNN